MKLVILDGYASNPGDLSWDGFDEFGELAIYERTTPSEVRERIKDADAVFTNKVRLNETNLKDSNVKYIGVIATGYDIIDIDYCKKNNIAVTNVPGYSTEAVCQMTFAHLLNYVNRVDLYAKANREGKWQESEDFCYYLNTIHDLAGKTFGIYGYGTIGKRVGEIARAFGMKVIMCAHKNEIGEGYKDVDSFLKEADIISLHAPLNDSTRGFINKENIAKMKDGVIIINTARGPLVDDDDVVSGINSGKIAAYLTDVLSNEPMSKPHPFVGNDRIFITPHIAWASFESRVRLMQILKDNYRAFLDGDPKNLVIK